MSIHPASTGRALNVAWRNYPIWQFLNFRATQSNQMELWISCSILSMWIYTLPGLSMTMLSSPPASAVYGIKLGPSQASVCACISVRLSVMSALSRLKLKLNRLTYGPKNWWRDGLSCHMTSCDATTWRSLDVIAWRHNDKWRLDKEGTTWEGRQRSGVFIHDCDW